MVLSWRKSCWWDTLCSGNYPFPPLELLNPQIQTPLSNSRAWDKRQLASLEQYLEFHINLHLLKACHIILVINFLSPSQPSSLYLPSPCFPVLSWHLPWVISQAFIPAMQSLTPVFFLRQSFNTVSMPWYLRTDLINTSFLFQPDPISMLLSFSQ